MFEALNGISDTAAYLKAAVSLLLQRGPTMALGMIIVLIGVALFIAGSRPVQDAGKAVLNAAGVVATKGKSAVAKAASE
ncbi:membrane protein [Microbacterium phage LuzDeMundo]|nr:membrane protein [Microbacterium phage MuffinTheCat]QWY84677.1 membrane protein [Microbacterium phage Badulia]UJQ86515.1 membrane protein [Microbacterium phage DesireeRose]UVG34200.1 membrane protein [Microbacterium phage LuzDeMundo]WGH20704.1 membrane protein [Microbacterium phage SCoupsA]WGH21167.1 membrane protein [Microbacterium phage Bee17]